MHIRGEAPATSSTTKPKKPKTDMITAMNTIAIIFRIFFIFTPLGFPFTVQLSKKVIVNPLKLYTYKTRILLAGALL
jgi:hypothetical protein